MSTFRFAIHLINQFKAKDMLTVIISLLFTTFLALLLGEYNGIRTYETIFGDLLEDGYGYTFDDTYRTDIPEDRLTIWTGSTVYNKDDYVTFHVMDSELLDLFSLPLYKGEWSCLKRNQVIIGGDIARRFAIGDKINLNLNGHSMSFIVGGVLKYNKMISFSSSGEILELSMLINEFGYKKDSVIICDSEEINDYKTLLLPEIGYVTKDLSVINFMPLVKMKELTDQLYKNKWITETIPYALGVLILLILGVIGASKLNHRTIQKEVAILYMLGLSWNKCILVVSIRQNLALFIGFVMGCLWADYIALHTNQLTDNIVDMPVFMFVFIPIACAALYTMYTLKRELHGKSPIILLKEDY